MIHDLKKSARLDRTSAEKEFNHGSHGLQDGNADHLICPENPENAGTLFFLSVPSV